MGGTIKMKLSKLSNLRLNPDNASTVFGLSMLVIEALLILGMIDKETKDILLTLFSSFVSILLRINFPMRKPHEI